MATKKKKKRYNGRPLSERTQFVLSLPRDMAPEEVIERARGAGLTISRGLLHGIRRKHKERWGAPVAEPAKNVRAGTGALSDQERDLLGLVLDVGYSRAAALLDSFRVEYFDALKKKG